jgi:hypothetical protein
MEAMVVWAKMVATVEKVAGQKSAGSIVMMAALVALVDQQEQADRAETLQRSV